MTPEQSVREFNLAFHRELPTTPGLPSDERIELGLRLIDEERTELTDAVVAKDIVEVADALGDIVYLCYDFAIACGIPLDAVFNEIHRSNMTKLDENGQPLFREDGKILKGPNYERPNIAAVLAGTKITKPVDQVFATREFVRLKRRGPVAGDALNFHGREIAFVYDFDTDEKVWKEV
jgi:NTP pyrophosphatase (non-canonical NTP hydrolase)